MHRLRNGRFGLSRAFRICIASAALLAIGAGAAAARIVWETGTVSGHVDRVALTSTGNFTFDAGDVDCTGVDYSAVTSSPGTYSVTFSSGSTGSWNGSFSAGGGTLVFGSTSGVFGFSDTELLLRGPITFSTSPPVIPLPAIDDLVFSSATTVFNLTPLSYDFTGPFQLSADASAGVVPNALATTEGPYSNRYPFGLGGSPPSQRYQQVYAASEFQCPGGRRFVTAISFRPDFASGSPFSSAQPVQINLSTTSRPPDALDSIYAANVGADDTVVYAGTLPLSSAATGGLPRDFDITIPLQTPFSYDPSEGNLLLDVRNFGGPFTTYFDAAQAVDSVSRVYNFNVGNPSGSPDTVGLVTQFSFDFPSPLILDFGEVEGIDLGGGAVRLLGAGVSATTNSAITDPSATVSGYLMAGLLATGTLGTGTFSPVVGGGPLSQRTLPIPGLLRICTLTDCGVAGLSVDFPLTENGAGLGLGGSFKKGFAVQISLDAAPWTIGTASISGIQTGNGGLTVSTQRGFAHGAASLTSTASQTSGVLKFVTPARIQTTIPGIETLHLFGVVKVHMVPEPGRLLMLGAGVAWLLLIGHRRIRP